LPALHRLLKLEPCCVYADAGGGSAGIGAARALANRHSIKAGDPTVRLIEALLKASPLALRRDKGAAALKFPEFRAWHAMLQPLFGLVPPDWTEKGPDQGMLALLASTSAGAAEEVEVEEVEDDEEDEGEEEEDTEQ
jgi:putative DNA methylase